MSRRDTIAWLLCVQCTQPVESAKNFPRDIHYIIIMYDKPAADIITFNTTNTRGQVIVVLSARCTYHTYYYLYYLFIYHCRFCRHNKRF